MSNGLKSKAKFLIPLFAAVSLFLYFAATALGLLSGFLVSEFLIPEKHRSVCRIYISSTYELSEELDGDMDRTASRSLASECCIVLSSPRAKELLSRSLITDEKFMDGSLTDTVRNSYSVDVTVVDDTEVLEISVTSLNPFVSAIVCEYMAYEVAPELIEESSVDFRLVYLSMANYTPVSSNLKLNMFIGALIGCGVVTVSLALCAVAFLTVVRTTRKKEAEILQNHNKVA